MRVLHVQKVKGIGGSERHLLSLLAGLLGAGDEIRMLVLAPGQEEARFIEAARAAGIDVVTAGIGHDFDPRIRGAIAANIRSFAPDIVHTHLIHADLWGQSAARAAGVPGVRSCHNLGAYYRGGLARRAGRRAGRQARLTIAISQHVAEFAAQTGIAPQERIRLVPYGIDFEAWAAGAPTREDARSMFGLDESRVIVGIASRLIEGKGHLTSFRALSLTKDPRLDLLVAGEGPLRSQLDEMARAQPDRIRMLGHVEDIRVFMAACDVLLFPTDPAMGEGFGLAALEAMASSRPVVVTRAGALPEIVRDGVTGLVAAADAAEIAAALDGLAADPGLRHRMGEAGRARAAGEFSLERMLAGTRAVYAEALAGTDS